MQVSGVSSSINAISRLSVSNQQAPVSQAGDNEGTEPQNVPEAKEAEGGKGGQVNIKA